MSSIGSTSRIGCSMCCQMPSSPTEAVEGQKGVAVVGDELDGRGEEFNLAARGVIRKRHANPAGLDPRKACGDLLAVSRAARGVDAKQAVTVGTGARAAGAVLDAKEVVEQRGYEIVVQAVDVERARWRGAVVRPARRR